MTETNHAIRNAAAWLENVHEMVAALDAAVESETGDGQDEAREAIEDSPLSIQVRDGWRNPGAESDGPEEYEILLSTGGPALRIVGRLDDYCQPMDATLQWQDWGTPWTDHETTEEDDRALMSFVGVFWFGE